MGRKGGNLESSPALEPLSLPAWRGQSSRVEMSRLGEKNRYQTPESSLKTSAPCLRGPHHLESSLARSQGGHSGHPVSQGLAASLLCLPRGGLCPVIHEPLEWHRSPPSCLGEQAHENMSDWDPSALSPPERLELTCTPQMTCVPYQLPCSS